MINTNELNIVNYCHPNCIPFKNICRLPEKEAFALAYELAESNPGATAFWRFADFTNYYQLRMKQDEYLYNMFISLGGKPKEKHPLSFVLQGSDYLNNWFDKGIITEIPLINIPSEYISFTFGDSGAVFNRTGEINVYTKEMLLDILFGYNGSIDEYMIEIEKKHFYIEAQLWNDDYLR